MRAWLARLSLVALGAALVFAGPLRPADAGTRLVAIGGNVRGDAQGRPFIQRDARHTSVGIVHPSCEGQYLRIETRPVSRFAPILSLTVDGYFLRHGYAAGLASVQGRRTLIGFTRAGESVDCAEVMSHPEGNLWVQGTVVR